MLEGFLHIKERHTGQDHATENAMDHNKKQLKERRATRRDMGAKITTKSRLGCRTLQRSMDKILASR